MYIDAVVSLFKNMEREYQKTGNKQRDLVRLLNEDHNKPEWDLSSRIVDNSPAAIMLLDTTDRIIYANKQASVILGESRSKTIGRYYNTSEFNMRYLNGKPIPEDTLPSHIVVKTKQRVSNFEHRFELNNRGQKSVSINAAPLMDSPVSCSGVLYILTDLTTEHRLRRLFELQRDMLVHIHSLKSIQEVLRIVLEYCISIEPIGSTGIFLYDQENKSFELTSCKGLSAKQTDWVKHVLETDKHINDMLFSGKAFFSNRETVFTQKKNSTFFKKEKAFAAVPLLQNYQTAGAITFFSHTHKQFPFVAQTIMESLGTWVGDIIHKKEAEEKLYTVNQELEKQKAELQKVNTALNVLINNLESEKNKQLEQLSAQFEQKVFPVLDSMQRIYGEERISQLLSVLRRNISHLLKGGEQSMPALESLSPKQLEVVTLIRENKTSKEIAHILGISVNSVFFHRKNIRRKLGIDGKGINLVSYLQL